MAVKTQLLDRRVLRLGAGVTILIAVPVAVAVRIVKGNDLGGQESNWWLAGMGAVLVAFFVGGWVAARAAGNRGDLPLSHSLAAGALAFAVMAVGSVLAGISGGGHLTQAYALMIVLMALLCVSAAVLGGFAAARRADRSRPAA